MINSVEEVRCGCYERGWVTWKELRDGGEAGQRGFGAGWPLGEVGAEEARRMFRFLAWANAKP